MKSGMLMRILIPRKVTWPKIKISQVQEGGRTDAILKIVFFSAISLRRIVRLMRNLAWWSRIIRKHGSCDQNCKFSKIQDGERLPFWKLLSHSVCGESSDFDDIWYADVNFDYETGHEGKKSKFYKSKMSDEWRLDYLFDIFFQQITYLHFHW